MRTVVSAMPAYLRQSLAEMFQYRGEIVLWAVWGVVYPLIAMAMWSAAVDGSPDGQTIRGFRPHDFAAYFWLTMVIGHLGTSWDVYEMGYLVQSGAMSPRLLRPILPVWQSVADNLAYKLLTLVILVPIWLVMIWYTQPVFETTTRDLLLGVPVVLMASIINYLWGYNLALLSFRLTRMDAIGQCWFGAGLFFGGRLAPLPIMPEAVQWIANGLPFKWVIWFPCEAVMGRLSAETVYRGMGHQMLWLALGLVAFGWLWRRGVRHYTAVGG